MKTRFVKVPAVANYWNVEIQYPPNDRVISKSVITLCYIVFESTKNEIHFARYDDGKWEPGCVNVDKMHLINQDMRKILEKEHKHWCSIIVEIPRTHTLKVTSK